MNEEKLISLFSNMLEEKLDTILDKKLDEKLDRILDEKLDRILDEKLNRILDKRFDEFHTMLSAEISEVFQDIIHTIDNKFKVIEETLNEHTRILNEHSKILNTLVISSKTNELKHQSYDSELGNMNSKLYEHETRLNRLESVAL